MVLTWGTVFKLVGVGLFVLAGFASVGWIPWPVVIVVCFAVASFLFGGMIK